MHRAWILVFTALAALFFLSCGDSDDGDCPFPAATCDTAAEIETLVRTGDTDEFLSHFEPSPFTCPGPSPSALGEAFPLCTGAAAGEVRHGYVLLNDTHGGAYAADALKDSLALAADRDDSSSSWRIVAISCDSGDASACSDSFTVVLSPANGVPGGDDPPTFLAVAVTVADDSGWHIDRLAAGFFFHLWPLFFEGGVIPPGAHAMFEPGDLVTRWPNS